MKTVFVSILLFFVSFQLVVGQESTVKIALLKYNGGGDWYSNPTALPNLIRFCNNNLQTSIVKDYETVDAGSVNIYEYPLVHMTGHGNVIFSPAEAKNLQQYLMSGGFLHISDNYGMDQYIRREMKKVFPDEEFVELPFSHPIYHSKYRFDKGLPKIHEHDDKAPQGFGIFYEGRLVCFYDYECDLGDGWEDPEVHNDNEAIRLKALMMGANIVSYVFNDK
jgi:hypothetical protein